MVQPFALLLQQISEIFSSLQHRKVLLSNNKRGARLGRFAPVLSRALNGRATVLLAGAIAALGALLALPATALALPSETPDNTPMVDGRVRTITHVGTNIWMGGKFTQVKQRNGTVVANVSNVAVYNSVTN